MRWLTIVLALIAGCVVRVPEASSPMVSNDVVTEFGQQIMDDPPVQAQLRKV